MKKTEGQYDILIVSDMVQKRNNISSRLRAQLFTLEGAQDGLHALHLIEKNSYRLVLLLNDMELMSKREVLQLIRIDETKETLPLIFLQEEESPDEISYMLENGANGFVVEGGNFQDMIDQIKSNISPKKKQL
jgi:DNA-binding response OmpR family regulator